MKANTQRILCRASETLFGFGHCFPFGIQGLSLLVLFLFASGGCDAFRPIESASKGPVSEVALEGTMSKGPSLRDSTEWIGPARVGQSRFLRAPRLQELEVPDYPGANSIWGATGRDLQGRMYFGVAGYGVDNPSAALWRLDPQSDRFETLGLVNEQLDRLGVRRKIDWAETQMKIHSKIFQAADGRMYFSSQDEHAEAADGSRNALYGGRLWAMDPKTDVWESIHTAPEGLIALAARGRYVVTQGYFGHVLYQYDTQTKQIRSKKLGTYKGHASRNIFMDSRGHVFGIRARIANSYDLDSVYEIGKDRVRISLVELDTEFNELNDWTLSDYAPTGSTDSHGITGFSELDDGSIVFVTHSGALWQIRQIDAKSKLERLGWIHPLGTGYCASLFSPFGRRYVCGFVRSKGGVEEWSIFDIELKRSVILPMSESDRALLRQPQLLIYGSDTLDDQSRGYIVGWKKRANRMAPYVIRLTWE
jgi:hypothetical protein